MGAAGGRIQIHAYWHCCSEVECTVIFSSPEQEIIKESLVCEVKNDSAVGKVNAMVQTSTDTDH